MTILFVLLGMSIAPRPSMSAQSFPYALRTRREVSLLAVGVGFGVTGLIEAGRQDPFLAGDLEALDPADVNPLDRPATRRWSVAADDASDILSGVLMTAPLALAAVGRGGERPAVTLTMYAETWLLTNSVVNLLKGTCNRTRPYAYNDDPAIPIDEKLSVGARRSFPSGHSANAFAAAVFAGTVYGDLYPDSRRKGWVWGIGLTAAATTASLRYAAGHHFPTDIIAGAALGGALGYMVPRLHRVGGVQVVLGAGPTISIETSF